MKAARPSAPARDTGLPPGVSVGSLGRRLVAYVVDLLIPTAAVLMITGAARGDGGGAAVALTVVGVLCGVAWALVCWQQLAIKAASPGMRLLKLQLVGFLDGRPVKWARVLLRFVVFALLTATGLGALLLLLSMLVNPRHQGWHDRAAGAVVIAERPLAPKRTKIRTTHTGAPSALQAARRDPVAPTPAPGASTSDTPAPKVSVPETSAPETAVPASVPETSEPVPVSPVVTPPLAGDPVLPAEPVPAGAPAPQSAVNGHAGRQRIVEGWVAELDDGREISVHGLVLLGRNPQPEDGEDDAALVKVSDDSRTVSKTHLAIGVDDAGLFVVDRGSTNGSVLTLPGQDPAPVGPFQAVPVTEGSVVSIGDHWVRIQRKRG